MTNFFFPSKHLDFYGSKQIVLLWGSSIVFTAVEKLFKGIKEFCFLYEPHVSRWTSRVTNLNLCIISSLNWKKGKCKQNIVVNCESSRCSEGCLFSWPHHQQSQWLLSTTSKLWANLGADFDQMSWIPSFLPAWE